MKRGILETLTGGAVLLAALAFAIYAAAAIGPAGGQESYRLEARFTLIDGLAPAADVRVAGIKVGRVTGWRIDPGTYQAVVEMAVRADMRFPRDSLAEIAGGGLLEGKYMRITPGQDAAPLAVGDAFTHTRDPVALEDLIARAIFMTPE